MKRLRRLLDRAERRFSHDGRTRRERNASARRYNERLERLRQTKPERRDTQTLW